MNSQVIEEDSGRLNIFANEPQTRLDESYEGYLKEGETLNGRLAMLGITAAIGAYVTTGQIIPGIL